MIVDQPLAIGLNRARADQLLPFAVKIALYTSLDNQSPCRREKQGTVGYTPGFPFLLFYFLENRTPANPQLH